MMKILQKSLLGFLFLAISLSFSESALAKGKVFVSEAEDFLVLYTFTGEKMKVENDYGKTMKMLELRYKLVNKAPAPEKLFSESGWAAVRFQDKEGFDLVRDSVSFDRLLHGREYYGDVWIHNKKVKHLKKVHIDPIHADRLNEILTQEERLNRPVENGLDEQRRERLEEIEEEVDKRSLWSKMNPLRVFSKKSSKKYRMPVEEFERPQDQDVEALRMKRRDAMDKIRAYQNPPVEEVEEPEPVEEVIEEPRTYEEYEDTEATYNLELQEDETGRVDNAELTRKVAEFDETAQPLDPREMEIEGAILNQEVAAFMAALEEQPADL